MNILYIQQKKSHENRFSSSGEVLDTRLEGTLVKGIARLSHR